eukprot:693744-Hanusia_phi.AAC.5
MFVMIVHSAAISGLVTGVDSTAVASSFDRNSGLVIVLCGITLVAELGGELQASRPDVPSQHFVEVALHRVIPSQPHDVQKEVKLDNVLDLDVIAVCEADAPQQRPERVEAHKPLRLELHLVTEVQAAE